MKRLVVLAMSVSACASTTASARLQSECAVDAGAPIQNLAPDQYPALAGRFRLIQVDNADTLSRPYAFVSQLTLIVADSAERMRSRARRIPFQESDRQLIGVRQWTDGRPTDSSEVSGAALYLGCRECMDASPNLLRIHHMSATGFSGSWFGGIAIGIRVNSDGRVLPNPSGYFCAQRLENPSAR